MPSNVWAQLASFFFVLAAVFADLLLLRFCLVAANALLVVAAAVGFPLWPDVAGQGVAIDTLVWSSISLALHLWALIRLLLDERPLPPLPDPDDEGLFQYFATRTGIGRSDFIFIIERGKWTHVSAPGKRIPCTDALHVIVDGLVECEVQGWKRRAADEFREGTHRFALGSGELFDLSLANAFRLPIGFYNREFSAATRTADVLLFSWTREALDQLASGPPVVQQAMKNLVAFAVADVAHRQRLAETEGVEGTLKRGLRHPDFRVPLPGEDEPPPKPFLRRVGACFMWILKSMDPRPPQGLRHYAVPKQYIEDTGTLRRQSVSSVVSPPSGLA
ncbi:hypothetical protein DFJ74DRAFT_670666 [Hyaloraphidium curvatum]|nr:hypothetical protein DFJ74DRAFT_670666 [Hyaloraphidium curvatum]